VINLILGNAEHEPDRTCLWGIYFHQHRLYGRIRGKRGMLFNDETFTQISKRILRNPLDCIRGCIWST